MLLRHEATGARHLHVDCADSNNTFAVAFLTVPADSTGVAHILEHTALCGSEKYPVRDPFFNMLKRSLNTFMNAFTGADWTMYPFSTENAADFRNLLSVYIDATLKPRLERMDFLQEGHRLEFDEETGRLTRTGVVFNEMHGALSDSSSLFREQLGAALYPDTTYGQNSGGDPECIPELTWQQLREFHSKHYHPSNALFYTYGDLPLESHLKIINEALSSFQPSPHHFNVDMQAAFPKPVSFETTGPPTPGAESDKQHKAALVWGLPDPSTDAQLSLGLYVLSELLLSGPSAPLYQALIESGLGSSYAPMTGYEPYNKQPSFGAGVTGATEENAAKVEQVVLETLEQCAKEGFSQGRVEAVLHQLELSNKHVTSGFGLQAGMQALLPWMHGGDPVGMLRMDPWMAELRKQLDAGGYLEGLIRSRLLQNTHRIFARQRPDETYTAQLKGREEAKLKSLEETLSEADKAAIRQDSEELKKRQNAPPNVECLPTLSVDDIPRSKDRINVEQRGGVRIAVQPTNGLLYLNAKVDLSSLPPHLLPALPLWCAFLPSQGAGGLDYRQFSEHVDRCSGGLSLSPSLQSHYEDTTRFEMAISFHVHCLSRNVDSMMDSVKKLLHEADWSDRANLASLLQQTASHMRQSLTRSGHTYAAKTAAAGMGRLHAIAEVWSGMTQISYVSQLAQMPDQEEAINTLLRDFADIERHVAESAIVRAQVNAEEGPPSESLITHVDKLWKSALQPSKFSYCKDGTNPATVLSDDRLVFYPVPSQVNFLARAVPTGMTLGYSHPDMAALMVGSKVMSSCFLHREIREKGGAYGGGCSMSSDGIFSMTSYRDPRLDGTLGTFDEAFQWLFQKGAFGDRDVLEAKLSVFAGLDKPIPPHSRGLADMMTGIPYERREEHRGRLLAVDRDAILNAFSNHVLPNVVGEGAHLSVAALGNDQLDVDSRWTKKKI